MDSVPATPEQNSKQLPSEQRNTELEEKYSCHSHGFINKSSPKKNLQSALVDPPQKKISQDT